MTFPQGTIVTDSPKGEVKITNNASLSYVDVLGNPHEPSKTDEASFDVNYTPEKPLEMTKTWNGAKSYTYSNAPPVTGGTILLKSKTIPVKK